MYIVSVQNTGKYSELQNGEYKCQGDSKFRLSI